MAQVLLRKAKRKQLNSFLPNIKTHFRYQGISEDDYITFDQYKSFWKERETKTSGEDVKSEVKSVERGSDIERIEFNTLYRDIQAHFVTLNVFVIALVRNLASTNTSDADDGGGGGGGNGDGDDNKSHIQYNYTVMVCDLSKSLGKPALRRYQEVVKSFPVIKSIHLVASKTTPPVLTQLQEGKNSHDPMFHFVDWEVFNSSFFAWDSTHHASLPLKLHILTEEEIQRLEKRSLTKRHTWPALPNYMQLLRYYKIPTGMFVLITVASPTSGWYDEPCRT